MSTQTEESKKNLAAVRGLAESLSRAKLTGITLDPFTGEAVFDYISDAAVSDGEKEKIAAYLRGRVSPSVTKVVVRVTKIVADGELAVNAAYDFVTKSFMSIARSVKKSDFSVEMKDGRGKVTVRVNSDVYAYFTANGVADRICARLDETFCDTFTVTAEDSGRTEEIRTDLLKDKVNPSDVETIRFRTYRFSDAVKLWGEELGDTAVYIADSGLCGGEATFAGKIAAISQKETKTGKPFFILDLDDTTGRLACKVFMTKEKEVKIQKINVGSEIAVRGDLSSFNGQPSFRVADLSFCKFPENFVPEERPSKGVPSEYSFVFPEPLTESVQGDFLTEARPVPECLLGKTFVVADIETTGLSVNDGDKVTEIGAVKIENGKITEKFQTLIDPERKISEEITALTGIDNGMVAGKPVFAQAFPDFFKFTDGCSLVFHNAEFDYRFLRTMARPVGYKWEHPVYDTMLISRELLPRLKNHKLNTVCEYFRIEFLHHRALSDAHATAKLFLELVAMKNALPDPSM